MAEKDVQVARKRGRGRGGRGNLGNARKKTFFFMEVFPYLKKCFSFILCCFKTILFYNLITL